MTFDSGDVVLLDVGSDWTLVAYPEPWVDHFEEPLDDDNPEFVRRSGKWSAVALSPDLSDALVGSRITSASLVHNEMGEVSGVRLVTETAVVDASQWGGELQVQRERG